MSENTVNDEMFIKFNYGKFRVVENRDSLNATRQRHEDINQAEWLRMFEEIKETQETVENGRRHLSRTTTTGFLDKITPGASIVVKYTTAEKDKPHEWWRGRVMNIFDKRGKKEYHVSWYDDAGNASQSEVWEPSKCVTWRFGDSIPKEN